MLLQLKIRNVSVAALFGALYFSRKHMMVSHAPGGLEKLTVRIGDTGCT